MERIYAILKKNFDYDEVRQKRKGLYFAGGSLIKELNEDDLLERLVVYGMNESFATVQPYLSNLLLMRQNIYGNSKLFASDATQISNKYKQMRAECVKKGFYKPKFPVRDWILSQVNGACAQAERMAELRSDMVADEVRKPLFVSVSALKTLTEEIGKIIDGSSEKAYGYAKKINSVLEQWRNESILEGLEGEKVSVPQTVSILKQAIDYAREWANLTDGVNDRNRKADLDGVEKYDERQDQLTSFV